MRDNEYRRHQGRDYEGERSGRDADNWGSQRQQGGYAGRDQGGYDQPSQGDYNRWGGQGRSQDYGADYGSSRFGGPGSSGYGGYGGGHRYQEDRSTYGRPQDQPGYGGSQQGGYSDRFSEEYANRQRGEPYGRGQDRYSEGFYGDASRFSGSGQDTNRSSGSQTHRDPDYHQWREEQVRNLDRDYDAWRGERYQKFSEDFNTWRSKRASQGNDASKQQQAGGSGAKSKDQG